MGEPDQTLSDRWARFRTAESILVGLGRGERARYHLELRDYVRWLLGRRGKADRLKTFEERVRASDAALEAKVEAGELSEAEAARIKGDRIWWRAMEETRGASLRIALGKMLHEEIVARLENRPSEIEETLDELQNEIEREITEKLQSLLGGSGS
ncbi:MAG TPA: hypothetical protein VN282_05640 [Pyrinomonadaceae bacterium]|nr:hypothetical protein [Pyrinomonadaceae bacterium]